MLGFIGEAVFALGAFLRGRARFRRVEFLMLLQECGAQALPIVTLICFLVGAILAFIGAVQLAMFGAQIYVANLVGMAMVLEMGAMMTAIIMAGRTGAAFAAQLGTMTVNEEIDALTTLGLSPMEFLVVPRMLALVTMMPLLTLYGDLLGILGGALIGVTVLEISPVEYFNQTARRADAHRLRAGPDQGRRLWHAGGLGGLFPRHAVRPQRRRGGTGHDLGGGHQHRLHHHRLRHLDGDLLSRVVGREGTHDHDTSRGPYHRQQPDHGLWQLYHPARPQLHGAARRHLHHHGRQWVRQEHPAAPSDRLEGPGPGGGADRRRELLGGLS